MLFRYDFMRNFPTMIQGDGELLLIALIVSGSSEEMYKTIIKLRQLKNGSGKLPNPDIKRLSKQREIKKYE